MNIKRLIYQSCHRGCKEMDILLGGFIVSMLDSLTPQELLDYSALLEISDAQIYDWLVGKAAVPDEFNTPLLHKLIEFSYRDKG